MNSDCQSSQEHNDRPIFENVNFFDTHTPYYIDNGIDLTLEFPSLFFLQRLSVQSRASQKTKLMKMSSRIGGAMEKILIFKNSSQTHWALSTRTTGESSFLGLVSCQLGCKLQKNNNDHLFTDKVIILKPVMINKSRRYMWLMQRQINLINGTLFVLEKKEHSKGIVPIIKMEI